MTLEPVTLAEILGRENLVWEALVRGDAELDKSMLSADFLGVYPSGMADREDHVGQLADGPSMSEFELTEARVLVIGKDDVLLAYRADYRAWSTDDSSSPWQAMFISSLWSRRDGQWINTFSQDTPTDPAFRPDTEAEAVIS